MIVDSSALMAILLDEKDAPDYSRAIRAATERRISAGTLLELSIVADALADLVARRRFDELLRITSLSVEPVTEEQARIGRQAYRDFGKGSGHPARLNFGDCFAYALAIDKGEPLLFKGSDFGQTGVRSALPSHSPGA